MHPRTVRQEDPERIPVYAVWELTLKCDQPCQHCGSRAGAARARELDTEEALRVADELADLGCREVVLIGGEAYLRDDVTAIVAKLAGRGVRVAMQTGGRALGEARARSLAQAGLTQVGVSLDGPARVHDRLRGNLGSHAAAIRAIEAARRVGLAVSANTQINRLNHDALEPMFEALWALGVRAWQVQLTVPMGRAADHPEWLLAPWQVVPVIDTLAAIQERAAARWRAEGEVGPPFDVFAGNNVGYFGPHETLLRSRPGGAPSHFEGCKAGLYAIGIESDGAVKGCPSLPTAPYRAGATVRDASLAAIWQDAAVAFPRGAAARELWDFCAECAYGPVCGGGCAWMAHATLGRRGNNPFCYHRVKELERRGVRERLVPCERAPQQPFDHGRFAIVRDPFDPTKAPEDA